VGIEALDQNTLFLTKRGQPGLPDNFGACETGHCDGAIARDTTQPMSFRAQRRQNIFLFRADGRGVEKSRGCVFRHADSGVSTRMPRLRFPACTTDAITSSGLHSYQPHGTLDVGISGYFYQRMHQHKYDTIEGFTKIAKNKSSAGAGKRKSGSSRN
jgi:hypothetical protein